MRDKDTVILQKIIAYIDEAREYTAGMDMDAFLADRKTMRATAFVLSQIGELVKNLSDACITENPDIAWPNIRGLRNRIAHDYEKVNQITLWNTVASSLPELSVQLTNILSKFES